MPKEVPVFVIEREDEDFFSQCLLVCGVVVCFVWVFSEVDGDCFLFCLFVMIKDGGVFSCGRVGCFFLLFLFLAGEGCGV